MNVMTAPIAQCLVAQYRPASLSAEHAVLARRLSRRRAVRNLGGFDLQVTAAPDTIADPVVFDLLSGSQAARVTMPHPLLHRLLEMLDPAAPRAAPDAVALLLELQLEPLLDRLEAGFPSLAVALQPAEAGCAAAAFAIGLTVGHGSLAETLRLDLDLAAGQPVAAALADLPDWPDPMPDLPVWLHLRALSADVTLAELDAARAGDVVLANALAGGEILVVLGERFVWRARQDGPRLQILTPRLRPRAIGLGRWVMGDAIGSDDASREDPDAGLDDLPVKLSFELGRLELPLSEVAVLGAGHVFELAREDSQPVDILANGRRIGRGRIVTVAGSIGVQIVRIGRE